MDRLAWIQDSEFWFCCCSLDNLHLFKEYNDFLSRLAKN